MKNRTSILFVLLFALFQTTNAQVSFGLRAGLNISDIRVANGNEFAELPENYTEKAGYHFGIFGEFPLNTNWSLRPELLFQQKGSQENFDFNAIDQEKVKFHQYYISLPLLARFHSNNFAVEAGPEISYRTQANFDPESPVIQAESLYDQQFDLGLAAGLGYALGRLEFGLRYTYGLANLSTELQFTDVNGEPLPEQPKLFNQALQASVGYVFFQE